MLSSFNSRIFVHAKIISIILKKVFWTTKGETTLVCLQVKPSCVLVLLLALTNLFVHSSIFVFIFRKEQPNLSSYKFFLFFFVVFLLFLFHNCYYHYCLNFEFHSPLHFENNSMRISKRSTLIIIIFIVFF